MKTHMYCNENLLHVVDVWCTMCWETGCRASIVWRNNYCGKLLEHFYSIHCTHGRELMRMPVSAWYGYHPYCKHTHQLPCRTILVAAPLAMAFSLHDRQTSFHLPSFCHSSNHPTSQRNFNITAHRLLKGKTNKVFKICRIHCEKGNCSSSRRWGEHFHHLLSLHITTYHNACHIPDIFYRNKNKIYKRFSVLG
jgi:hypothetical protein